MEHQKKIKALYISDEQRAKHSIQVVTIEDLNQFGNDLLREIQHLLIQKQFVVENRWLKSVEVKKILKISSGTLQHLRDTGRLPYTKVGGIIYYDSNQINDLIQNR